MVQREHGRLQRLVEQLADRFALQWPDHVIGAIGDGLGVGGDGIRRVLAGVVDAQFRAALACVGEVGAQEAVADRLGDGRELRVQRQQQCDAVRRLISLGLQRAAAGRLHGAHGAIRLGQRARERLAFTAQGLLDP